MKYTVYILYSKKLDRYYVGHSGDIEDRLNRHNQGRSKATKAGTPWELLYAEEYTTKSEAYQREVAIKNKKSRKYIEALIAG